MSDNLTLLRQTLKQHHQSTTKVREAVFAALDYQEPQTMSQLSTRVTPSVDRASVYRTISLFEKLGIVQRLQIGWKHKLELSNKFQAHHHHISCLKCGSLETFHEDTELESAINEIAKKKNFKLINHQLELQGFCQNCQ